MKRTKVVSISLPEELISEIEIISSKPEYKFYSKSHAFAYIINLGINNFKEGQRLVSFIDSIIGGTTNDKRKHN